MIPANTNSLHFPKVPDLENEIEKLITEQLDTKKIDDYTINLIGGEIPCLLIRLQFISQRLPLPLGHRAVVSALLSTPYIVQGLPSEISADQINTVISPKSQY